MNAIIARAALLPRSPLWAVSIQSPFSALLGVFGHEGADRTASEGFAASVAHDERLLVLKALSGASWNGSRLPPLPALRYQFVSRPSVPLPNESLPCDPLNAYAAQLGMLQSLDRKSV